VANVPFAFQIGQRVMPAGAYSVTELNPAGLLKVTAEASQEAVLVSAFVQKSGTRGQSKLTFHCYGNACFLSEIWFRDEDSGHATRESKRERELMANRETSKVVYLAMR